MSISSKISSKIYSAPGKLFIAGEWAVLYGSSAIVAAVDKRVYVKISSSPDGLFHVALKDFKVSASVIIGKELQLRLSDSDAKLMFAEAAIEVSVSYLGKTKPFTIETWSDFPVVEGSKVGLGSSAASVSAIVAAVLGFNNASVDEGTLFKLSAIAHFRAQGFSGSCADVAGSCYGGVIFYRMFDAEWLSAAINAKSTPELVHSNWPLLSVERIGFPEGLSFLAGFTGECSSTKDLIRKAADLRKKDKESFMSIMKEISEVVSGLRAAWANKNNRQIIALIRENRILLKKLDSVFSLGMETQKLKMLADIAEANCAAGKLSGAGGGDIGIAVSLGRIPEIADEWKRHSIMPLDINISYKGIGGH